MVLEGRVDQAKDPEVQVDQDLEGLEDLEGQGQEDHLLGMDLMADLLMVDLMAGLMVDLMVDLMAGPIAVIMVDLLMWISPASRQVDLVKRLRQLMADVKVASRVLVLLLVMALLLHQTHRRRFNCAMKSRAW
jgi:hypothetical protein